MIREDSAGIIYALSLLTKSASHTISSHGQLLNVDNKNRLSIIFLYSHEGLNKYNEQADDSGDLWDWNIIINGVEWRFCCCISSSLSQEKKVFHCHWHGSNFNSFSLVFSFPKHWHTCTHCSVKLCFSKGNTDLKICKIGSYWLISRQIRL